MHTTGTYLFLYFLDKCFCLLVIFCFCESGYSSHCRLAHNCSKCFLVVFYSALLTQNWLVWSLRQLCLLHQHLRTSTTSHQLYTHSQTQRLRRLPSLVFTWKQPIKSLFAASMLWWWSVWVCVEVWQVVVYGTSLWSEDWQRRWGARNRHNLHALISRSLSSASWLVLYQHGSTCLV